MASKIAQCFKRRWNSTETMQRVDVPSKSGEFLLNRGHTYS